MTKKKNKPMNLRIELDLFERAKRKVKDTKEKGEKETLTGLIHKGLDSELKKDGY